jgi:DNA segregation ATPase FtsK/SpoIIIE, S-DNA-T family
MQLKLPKLPAVLPSLELDLQSKFTLAIVLLSALGVQLYLSLINLAGPFGAIVGQFMRNAMGRGAVFMPTACFVIAVMLVRIQRRKYLAEEINGRLVWGVIIMIWSVCGYLNLFGWIDFGTAGRTDSAGGLFGYVLYPLITGWFSNVGGFFCLFFVWAFGFFLFSNMTPHDFVTKLQKLRQQPELFWDFVPDIFEFWRKQTNDNLEPPKPPEEKKPDIAPITLHVTIPEPKVKPASENLFDPKVTTQTTYAEIKPDIADQQPKEGEVMSTTGEKITWNFPSFDLLKDTANTVDPGDIDGNKDKIAEALKSFNIDVEMKEVTVGPTVSQYTMSPASGVKLSTIEGLQSNLAYSLAASSVRVEAPIPGKSLVGIEIPNKVKATVRLKSLIQTSDFKDFKGDLPLAIGLDVGGKNLIYSLAKMPHLLVAGSTGSGKSVWINNMLLCLLYRYSPQDLQLLLVDMKRVELKLYDGIPHLLAPVITDAEKAINSLKWSVLEMERRYRLLEDHGKRNIVDYNKYVAETQPAGIGQLTYIVFVIDELGDLMMLAKNEVEPIIVRLTQMSRAVGIHLVLGTQRPDTQVVTGLIKANVPTRIAFAVASGIDSRVILDQIGAEKLLGQGDGMMMSPSTMKAVRFQGAFVEEDEVKKCVDYVKTQVGTNTFLSNFNAMVTEPPRVKINVPGMRTKEDDLQEGLADDIYNKAKEIAFTKGMVSTSMLQTSLGIGYPRARKFIQTMEEEGVVGPPNGSKPREVFPPEDWEM